MHAQQLKRVEDFLPDALMRMLCVCRPDGKVAYGFSLFRGKRSNMEDFHHAQVQRS